MELINGRINKFLVHLYITVFMIIVLIPISIYNYLYIKLPFIFILLICFLTMAAGSLVMEKIYTYAYEAARNSGEIVVPQSMCKALLFPFVIISFIIFGITFFDTRDLLISAILPYYFTNGAFIWIYVVDSAIYIEKQTEIRVDKLRKEGKKVDIFKL